MSCVNCKALRQQVAMNKQLIVDYRKSIGAPYDVNRDELTLTKEQKKRLAAYEARFDEARTELELHLRTPHG